MVGSSSSLGVSAMRQRQSPFFSLHLVSISDPPWSYIMKLFSIKITLQLASHMGPKPMRVWQKEVTTLSARGKSRGRLGRPKLAAPLDWCGWSLAVPTVILGAVGSKLIVDVFFLRSRIQWRQSLLWQCGPRGCKSFGP